MLQRILGYESDCSYYMLGKVQKNKAIVLATAEKKNGKCHVTYPSFLVQELIGEVKFASWLKWVLFKMGLELTYDSITKDETTLEKVEYFHKVFEDHEKTKLIR